MISWRPLRLWPWRWHLRRPRPSLWVSWRPNGIGLVKPNHYGEMLRTVWANRRNLKYGWNVLTKGACDGCALGVAGLHDWGQDGIHLCSTRLRLLEFNTAGVINADALSDVASIDHLDGAGLRELGRLGYPMRRRAGESGFSVVSWDEALSLTADAIRSTTPDRVGVYLTSRGLTNEVYYAAGKAARSMGVASIDSAARVCHAPSTVGLKATIGVAATTCSMEDIIASDLVVIWGANPAANQPVFTKYLYLAKARGCKVVVVNPLLEPALDRYWVPSNLESAVFGTQLCDLHVPVRPGGDVALAQAVLKRLVEKNSVDVEFIEQCTTGWAELTEQLNRLDKTDLLAASGVDAGTVEALADLYSTTESAIFVWSMGITQRADAVDGVRAIVNLALSRGMIGRDGAGLMPIRGHSGVQGGAEMGAYATALPGGVDLSDENCRSLGDKWGFEIPREPARTAPELVEAALSEEIDVLLLSGGNMVDVLPDPQRVSSSLSKVKLRVHLDVVATTQMLVDGEDVLVLPVRTRYEQEGGGTETSTERRIIFSPEIPRTVGTAKSEWRLWGEIASRVNPSHHDLFNWSDNQRLRAEIAEVVPAYAGIEGLSSTGDSVQWGGRHLCAGGKFPTADGKARFTTPTARPVTLPDGAFMLSTRRGKQFNSIVHGARDPLTGTARDAVFMNRVDATRLGLSSGDPVVLESPAGHFDGTVHLADIAQQSLQVVWPEGNVLMSAGVSDSESGIPDYNAVVTVRPR